MKNTILVILSFIFPLMVFSQNCTEFMVVQKSGITYPWKYDNQSRSGLFVAGKSSQLNVICNEGKDYKISFLASSVILKSTNIKVTDENGNTYFTYGADKDKAKDIASKREFLLSLENQKLKIKTGKKRIELDANINNLKLEIQKYQQEVDMSQYTTPKTFFEFTPAETMNLIINITVSEDCAGKGCIGALITNKKAEKSGF